MKLRNAAITIIAALVTFSAIQPAHGWVTRGKWRTNRIIMRAGVGSFPSGGARRAALATVVARFNKNPSNVWFDQRYNDSSLGLGNGQSETWFSSDSRHNPAVCYTWYDYAGYIKEADVVCCTRTSYTSYMNKTTLMSYGGSKRPYRTTAMHEYGHAACLKHEDDEYNMMGQSWTHIHCNGDTARCYLGEDASSGLVAKYGRYSGGSRQDVSASMFEWCGRNGEYSRHNLCDVYNMSGYIVTSTGYNGQRRYLVTRGNDYKFEFTYENNGETQQRVRVGYYLSTNNTISTSDRLLETTWMTLGRADVLTSKRTIRIPTNISSNRTYYIGVKVDDNNTLGEVDGGNNCAYHIIKTR